MAKLIIEFNEAMDDLLGKLAAKGGISKTAVISRAIALYDYVERETWCDDQKGLAITKDGVVVRTITL